MIDIKKLVLLIVVFVLVLIPSAAALVWYGAGKRYNSFPKDLNSCIDIQHTLEKDTT